MISIDEYKANPCRLSAIPYWKMKTIKTPSHITVIHDDDYSAEPGNFSGDTLYFRLMNNLKSLKMVSLDKMYAYRYVNTDCISDLEATVEIINKCYLDIHVELDQVRQWTRTAVFCSELWVFIIDVNRKTPIALGIAELDREVREGALEWIQVLPEYRGRKLGQALIRKLLMNLHGRVDFVTVSGKVDNETKPEKLYRRCGFTGNDLFHVLIKE